MMKKILPLLLCVGFSAHSQAISFTLTDLGTLGGIDSQANDINNLGQVVGQSRNSSGVSRAFVYSGGVMQEIGTFGGTTSVANAINDSGLVVGSADLSGNTGTRAFAYSGGILQNIGTLGGNFSEANGLNSAGQIVGIASTTQGRFVPFRYSSGVMTNLGSLGGSFGYALGMNSSGQIVGDSNTAAESEHGFLYQNGVMTDLGTLPGGQGSTAKSINESGQIAGYSYQIGETEFYGEAFVITGGVMTSLGILNGVGSLAYDINNHGQVTGTSKFGLASNSRGIYWADGTLHDLNSLVDSSGVGWTIMEGTGINDLGMISATARNSAGQLRAVVLNPVPEPATMAVLGASILVGLKRRKQTRK